MKTITVAICGRNETYETCAQNYTIPAAGGRLNGPSPGELPVACGLDDTMLVVPECAGADSLWFIHAEQRDGRLPMG